MADPRTMHLDRLSRPWETVAELVHCPRCLGALPADDEGACSWCGVWAARAPAVDTSALDDGGALDALVAELSVPLPPAPPPAPPKLSWWERFARWPHA